MFNHRNIGIAAHIDAGKTTTTERMLFLAGLIHRTGEVHDGNTVTDYLEVEKRRGITVMAAATNLEWTRSNTKHSITLIDTPGHVDFTIEVERSMRVLDGAIAVFDASQGVEPQSETVWRQAERHYVPRIAFVNKMDKVGADFSATLEDMRLKLGARVAAIQLPWFEDSVFVGFFDVLEQTAYRVGLGETQIPDCFESQTKEARVALVELLAEFDEAIFVQYANQTASSSAELRAALRVLCMAGTVTPVLCGASKAGVGVEALLDAVVDFLPSPFDRQAVQGLSQNQLVEVQSDVTAPLVAFVFKLLTDPFVGRLAFVRVYRGRLEAGSTVKNSHSGQLERISKLVKLQANSQVQVQQLEAGEIGAILAAKNLTTGDTLVGETDTAVMLEAIQIPERVMAFSIAPKTQSDQERFAAALHKLLSEDPSLELHIDPETGEQHLSGMGELHLEVTIERLRSEHQVEVKVGQPSIAYRETIQKAVELEVKHIKQQGGNGQYAKVTIRAMPLERGAGVQLEDISVGGALPKSYSQAFQKGLTQALKCGLFGYPVTDLKISLLGGATHQQDSSEMAFFTAGILAVRQMLELTGTQKLEPIMEVDVTTPPDFTGSVIGDLNTRRGVIKNLENKGASSLIKAFVPLQTLFGYAGALRSRTQGRAGFSMRLHGYEKI
ncbi:MAG: hypothetical protein RLZZ156_2386 [Deinococcota bacterium]|jgi:elongation factor G